MDVVPNGTNWTVTGPGAVLVWHDGVREVIEELELVERRSGKEI